MVLDQNLDIPPVFLDQKYFRMIKILLLVAFQSDLGLKPVTSATIFV